VTVGTYSITLSRVDFFYLYFILIFTVCVVRLLRLSKINYTYLLNKQCEIKSWPRQTNSATAAVFLSYYIQISGESC